MTGSTTAAPVKVTILGATGSVGRAVLDVMAEHPERFEVEALVCGRDGAGLARLARERHARFAAVSSQEGAAALAEGLAGSGIRHGSGAAAVNEAAVRPADIVVAAITGTAGLAPTLAAVEAGLTVALANKESLVAAGAIMMSRARPGQILPLDSEHNALAQALGSHPISDVAELILTASGGPFRTWSVERIAAARPEDALAHPNWSMGAKITIDSASLMNKGLELIEASHLFGLGADQLGVLVHPQSIVHGLVAFRDGSVTAGMAVPDMRVPVAHCLGLGQRLDAPSRRLDLARLADLSFEPPDMDRFPALALARQALAAGGGLPIVLNAANEIAVEAFLARRIGFGRIPQVVAEQCEAWAGRSGGTPTALDEVLGLDEEVRASTREVLSRPLFAVT